MEKNRIILSDTKKMESVSKHIELVIIGGSAGSLTVLLDFLKSLEEPITFSVVIVIHRKASSSNVLSLLLQQVSAIVVEEIDDKMEIKPNHIYLVPADFHVLFENKCNFALDRSEKLNYSRPSIDIAFRSAAEVYKEELLAILLSGANSDGVDGLKYVKLNGGKIWIQDPKTAEVDYMPKIAVENVDYDAVMSPEDMVLKLNQL